MSCVDLNPARAAIADDMVTSDYTSIQSRIQQVQVEAKLIQTHENNKPRLMPFIENENERKIFSALPIDL